MESKREINEVDDSISVLVDNDGIVDELRNSIQRRLLSDSPMPAFRCIFKVPEKIRSKKEPAYKPDIVSIGPYHSGPHDDSGKKFRLMENVKHWYLHRLLSRHNITLAGLIKGVMDLDKRARDCYADPFDPNINFVGMMVLDGCFLIELFRNGPNHNDMNDPVYSVSCTRDHLCHDLILLENQLPWFVLQRLYNLTAVENTTSEENASSLINLVLKFFERIIPNKSTANPKRPGKILHILDLVRAVIVARFEAPKEQRKEEKSIQLLQTIPNVTTLSKAGIRFQKGSSDCILDINFKNGVFTIPPLPFAETTEPLFRNLIAFEQCHCKRTHKITSYAVLMESFIDSSKDIDLLCERQILGNWLSAQDAAQFFNLLYNDATVDKFYYSRLCANVNEYYDSKWNKWMGNLWRKYLDTPWTVISLIAAFILLVLTALQTVYTMHQYYHPPK